VQAQHVTIHNIDAYVPPNQAYCGTNPGITCDTRWGDIVGRNFLIPTGRWNTLAVTVDIKLGIFQVFLNQRLEISYSGVRFGNITGFNGIKFDSFFGGSTSAFTNPRLQYAFFRNFSMYGS
jgi:hypothetical protein